MHYVISQPKCLCIAQATAEGAHSILRPPSKHACHGGGSYCCIFSAGYKHTNTQTHNLKTHIVLTICDHHLSTVLSRYFS